MPGFAVAGIAEAQRIHVGDRPGAHGENITQDPADPGGGALIGLDIARVVMAFHLEDRRLAIADIDDAGVLTRAADHPRGLGGKPLQMDARGFVRAMLRPHDRINAQLGQVRLTPERVLDTPVFLFGQAVLGHQFGGDFLILIVRFAHVIFMPRAETFPAGS